MSEAREKNHGEGNPEADRVYREGAEKFARSSIVEEKAREAASSLDRRTKGHAPSQKKK